MIMMVMTIVMMMTMMRNDGSGDSGDQVIPMVTRLMLVIDGHHGGNASVSDCGGYGKGDFDYGYGYGDL